MGKPTPRSLLWNIVRVIVVSTLMVVCASCTAPETSPPQMGRYVPQVAPTAPQTATDGTVFTGPYSVDFLNAYVTAESEQAKAVLEDGAITAEERQAVKSAFVDCLSGAGMTNIVVNDNGSMSFDSPASTDDATDSSDTAVQRCEASTGWREIGPLAHWIDLNPENIDFPTLVAGCMVRVGLAPEGYTAQDYMSDLEAGVLAKYDDPSTEGYDKFKACQLDPAQTK